MVDSNTIDKELLDQRKQFNVMAQFLLDEVEYTLKDENDQSAWQTLLDYEDVKTREQRLALGPDTIVPIPPHKFIFHYQTLVEIVQEQYTSIKDTDMVVMPSTSVLYPHYEGPRELFLKGDRLKINKHLKDHLMTQQRPQKLSECLVVEPEDLVKSHGIKKLLFVAAPTEQFRNSLFYREVKNFLAELNHKQEKCDKNIKYEDVIKQRHNKKKEDYNVMFAQYEEEEKKQEADRDQLRLAELARDLKREEGLIEDLLSAQDKNRREINKLKNSINQMQRDLAKKKILWHEKMRCFFKSFMWNILLKFHEDLTLQTLALPPIAMDIEDELFTPQYIANLMLQTLQDFLILKYEEKSPKFHIKIVCERDKEYLAFRKGYDQLKLDFFVSQGLIQNTDKA